ncbi:MAG: hypothetical protein VX259_06835, partial [Pseudomonadota bacterium]|nr:hypothetical protein [Pseudomonadota bacterium]
MKGPTLFAILAHVVDAGFVRIEQSAIGRMKPGLSDCAGGVDRCGYSEIVFDPNDANRTDNQDVDALDGSNSIEPGKQGAEPQDRPFF